MKESNTNQLQREDFDTPSKLIRVALEDMKKCENDPHYVIDMNSWGELEGNVCHVCLAGAFLVHENGMVIKRGQPFRPYNLTRALYFRILALDDFRRGNVIKGLANLNIHDLELYAEIDGEFNPSTMPTYAVDRDAFISKMEAFADKLESFGY